MNCVKTHCIQLTDILQNSKIKFINHVEPQAVSTLKSSTNTARVSRPRLQHIRSTGKYVVPRYTTYPNSNRTRLGFILNVHRHLEQQDFNLANSTRSAATKNYPLKLDSNYKQHHHFFFA
ncbi:hypothetical protein Droror1_Dr00011592 [Drosera rotundifolia]